MSKSDDAKDSRPASDPLFQLQPPPGWFISQPSDLFGDRLVKLHSKSVQALKVVDPVIRVTLLVMCIGCVNADENSDECGLQRSSEETWKTWHDTYTSGDWKRWFACHDKGAQAGLFLSAAISTPDSGAKTRVMEKHGRCDSRPRPSLECVTQDNVAEFFHDITVIDEALSRFRLSRIWNKNGTEMAGAKLVSIEQQDDQHATGKVQSIRPGGQVESWTVSFVRVGRRWFVTFKWGM